MKTYKHYSFDVWLTLIKSDVTFKRKRAEYFHQHFNRSNFLLPAVEGIIKDVDNMCNDVNQLSELNIDTYEMYGMILYRLGYDMKTLQRRDLDSIYHICETLFLQHPPVLYDNSTLFTLKELRKRGATISILSNTAFIRGTTLKKLLETFGINKYLVDFQIYSDEAGLSKPSQHLFREMINMVHAMRKHTPVTDAEIVHVGDSIKADIEGANRAGIDAIQINSNDKTIKDLL